MKLSSAISLPAVLLVLWSGGTSLSAQVPGNLDPAYQPPVLDQGAQVVVIQPDKKALLGGAFTTFNGAAVSPLIRLNADGTLDGTFAGSAGVLVPRENANVNALAVQTDGTIVASAFGTTDAQATLTRLEADGTLDPSFSVTLPNGGVTAIALETGSVTLATERILIGGTFTTVNATSISALASLELDGTPDPSFVQQAMPDNPSMNLIAQVAALAVQPNGKIVVAGTINTDAGPASGIVRLNANGGLDPFFTPVTLASGTFQSLALQPDGSIVASGSFTTVNGVAVPNIARFSGVDGSLDQSFAAGDGFTAGFNQLAVQADGKILCGSNAGGNASFVRLNADGSVDRDYTPGFLAATSTVTALALQPDGLGVVSGTLLLPNAAANQPNASVVRLLASVPTGVGIVTVTVPATANPWLAPLGATDPKDTVAVEAPARVTGLTLAPGTVLTFSATGLVSIFAGNNAAYTAPDGLPGSFPTHPAENGLSGVTSNYNSLVGVFINDTPADPTDASAPASLDFSSFASVPGGVDYAVLQPALGQVFFIGDGVTSGNVLQQVVVPDGATHLALGTVDTDTYADNSGAFQVTVTATGITNTPLTATVLTVTGADVGATVPQGTPLTFTATQGAVSPGISVSVQATMTPTDDGSWTSLPDATNGSAGLLKGDGNGNYVLTTTQYPGGDRVYFRAVATLGATTSVSKAVGYYSLESANAPTLRILQSASTPDDPNANVAIIGDQITYTYSVYNDGPQTATNVSVVVGLPSAFQLQSADAGYSLSSTNVVTWTIPTLPPTTGGPLMLRLVASIRTDANVLVGTVFNTHDSVVADGATTVEDAHPVTTTITEPLEVVVTSNSTSVSPGQVLLVRVDVRNRTATTIKQASVNIPLPVPQLTYGPAYFADVNGLAVAAPKTKDGSPNPQLTSTNNLLASFGNLAPGASEHLLIPLTVPIDIDPAAALTLPGGLVTTKTPVNGTTSFGLPDITVALSGVSPATEPQITFAKVVVDPINFLQLAAQQPKLTKQLTKALAAIAVNPALLAQFNAVYPGLSALSPATATINQLLAAINPDIGYSTSDLGDGTTVTTVDEPSTKKPETYLAFLLAYANAGGANANGVTITDVVPAGTSILDANGNYNGSVIINGKPGTLGGNLSVSGDGRTLGFTIGTIQTGTKGTGFILYKVRLLTPGETGAPTSGTLLSTSGSVLSSPLLSHQHLGQPDGEDVEVVGRYDYFCQPTTPTGNSTTLSEGVTYDIYYKNTGDRASKILEIDDPIPAGLQYLGCELLDADHQTYNTPAGAVDVPPIPAGQPYPTSGTLVFHPPLFDGSGRVAPGASGYIREYFYPTPTALADGHPVFFHSPVIPDSSYAITSRRRGAGGVPQVVRRGPVTRADGSGTAPTATDATLVDDPSLSKVFIAAAMPMTMVEGQPSEIFVVEGCLNDTALHTGFVKTVLPPGVQYVNTVCDVPVSVEHLASAAGGTIVGIQFGLGLAPHSANFAKIVVQPAAGTASAKPVAFPNCYLETDDGRNISLQTGPLNVSILTAADANALAAPQASLKTQIAGNALTAVGVSSPQLQEFVDHIGRASRIIALAGASGVSTTDGVLMVPLLGGSAPQGLAMGSSGALAGDGTTQSLYSGGLDFLVESGRTAAIKTGPFTARSGTLPATTMSSVLTGISTNAPGNLVTTGAATLLHLGGGNLIGQDGSTLIGQDGSSAVAKAADLISQDGGGIMAAGRSNTDGLISQDGGGLISQDGGGLISQDGGGLISQDGGSLISQDGGNIVAAGGGNLVSNSSGTLGSNSSGTLVGTPTNSAGFHATASGNLIQGGSAAGLVSNSGGGN